MADPRQYRPEQGAIPTQPGVYRFLDGEGRVLYVGKAKNLRARLSSYFQDPAGLSDRIRTMVYTAEDVKWVVVGSEVEALTLEYLWIKEFTPPFNVVFRDNKSYPYLAVSLGEEYPRVWVTRQEHRKGTRYLGPYTKVWAIRETLDQLLSVFPMRSCTKSQFNQARRLGRPCLFGHIGKCSAPCIERVTPEEHRETAMSLIRFMEGGGSKAIATRRKRMLEAANAEEYETAARLRDEISALEAVNERNVIVLNENLDVDIFGIAFDEIEASVQVFYVRGGRIRGQQAWISDEIGGLELSEIVSNLVLQVYGDVKFDDVVAVPEASRSVDDRAHTPLGAIPSEIWVPGLPEDALELQKWLAERRGGTVRLKTPRRGDKAKLAHTVRLNAEQALARHKLARAGDITVRSQALEELRDALELDRAPLRIECYDVSHTQGTHQVASMVVFEDGLAKKADYRHFIVRGPDGEGAADDTAAMDEVLRRRLARLLAGAAGDDVGAAEDEDRGDRANASGEAETPRETENARKAERVPEAEKSFETGQISKACDAAAGAGDAEDAAEAGDAENATPGEDEAGGDVPRVAGQPSAPRRFAYKPDLIVVDGGLPQVNAAQRVVEETGADVRIVGLAKRLEEVWIPGEDFPVVLPRRSPSLRLLQQLRDESHRFAITFHRKKRAKAMTRSALDAVPGLGAAKQKALLGSLGSLAKIKAASQEELLKVPGIGPALARAIVEHFADAG
ncbi:excinuclease ABC subunit C [Peptidiphaga gingivicola]|uniref:UvrABC system protein C n=1 Tax=Peptidiphaga gingivicola TaxID=2741497 RepID=A0A179B745_9ACTO|nr:excinuclease ABC subunit UvrC [Peptidiphaga gingivicola]OAP86931.1 excinuclease ABC subunit C [Peptidiphaga gingivicola]